MRPKIPRTPLRTLTRHFPDPDVMGGGDPFTTEVIMDVEDTMDDDTTAVDERNKIRESVFFFRRISR